MYLDNDPGVLISACLFGDGAGAAVLSNSVSPDRRKIKWQESGSLINPDERDALRFESRGGLLRNILTRAVPMLARDHVSEVLELTLTLFFFKQKTAYDITPTARKNARAAHAQAA